MNNELPPQDVGNVQEEQQMDPDMMIQSQYFTSALQTNDTSFSEKAQEEKEEEMHPDQIITANDEKDDDSQGIISDHQHQNEWDFKVIDEIDEEEDDDNDNNEYIIRGAWYYKLLFVVALAIVLYRIL